MKIYQNCNSKKLFIGIRKIHGLLNWTTYGDGRYKFSGARGQFLQLLLDYLEVPVKFYDHLDLIKMKRRPRLDMILKYATVGPIHFTGDKTVARSYEMNSMTFAVKKSVQLPTKFAFFYPFTISTWLGIVFTLILLPAFGIL